jgi:hypothetical protein
LTLVHGDEVNNVNSILDSIKKLLGMEPDYTDFDTDVIIHINSAIMILNQLGIGNIPFSISSNLETWKDFLGEDLSYLEAVKTYIYIKVKLVFDPPTSSFVITSLESKAGELEWRFKVGNEIMKEL